LTDLNTYYARSGSSAPQDPVGLPTVADDATKRIYFEATKRYQDTIVPELEGGTTLRAFRTSDFQFGATTIASGSRLTGFAERLNILSGSDITNLSTKTLAGLEANFKDLRILGTQDIFSNSTDFKVSPATGSFKLSTFTKLTRKVDVMSSNPHIENLPSLFQDARLSHFPNFKYLPPTNVPKPGHLEGTPLGMYPQLAETPITTLEDLNRHLEGRQYTEYEFLDTSRDNNLICQMFKYDVYGFEKLSIIDFGEFADDDPYSPGKRIFFLGKMVRDANGSETFLNIFTLVFD